LYADILNVAQTQNSDYKQSILWLEKAREEDRKKMVENGRVEAAAQRIEFLEEALASEIQKALESKEELEREQSYAHVKIQELQEQIHELTLNTVRNKETNDSARRVLHLHEGHGHEVRLSLMRFYPMRLYFSRLFRQNAQAKEQVGAYRSHVLSSCVVCADERSKSDVCFALNAAVGP
jgi:hypothetical protein